jgi:hypothetical protein
MMMMMIIIIIINSRVYNSYILTRVVEKAIGYLG